MDHALQGARMSGDHPSPIVDLTFPHNWQAEILPARPLILPNRHFVYPRDAEEIERGALEVLIRPAPPGRSETRDDAESGVDVLKGHDFSRAEKDAMGTWALAPEGSLSQSLPKDADPSRLSEPRSAQPFLATCALGFRDPAVPTGLWSCPNPGEICAVSGGYAYILSTTDPTRFTMIPFRPVLEVRAVAAFGLLLFVSHHSILAMSAAGQAWQSEKLSDEGIAIVEIEAETLHGRGWNMMTDKETRFILDLKTGLRN
jgi:hypothetical protein